jgi:ribonuclease P protein component
MTDRPRETLPRSVRIRSRRDFERVFALKIRVSDSAITLYGAPSSGVAARLGIAAGRRLGNAVVRNRAKRLIREAFRRVRHALPHGTDWVVVPKAGADLATHDLQVAITTLAGRIVGKLRARPATLPAPHASVGSEELGATAKPVDQRPTRRDPGRPNARKKKAPGA